MRGLRRAIVLRLISRFGDVGVYFTPWLTEFPDADSLEAFFDAIETAASLDDLLPLFPNQP